MSVFVCRDGETTERRVEGPRTVAEVLTKEEFCRVEQGELVVTTTTDEPLHLDAPVLTGQTIVLRPPLTLTALEAAGHQMTLLYGFVHYCEKCGGVAFGFVDNRCFHAPGGSRSTSSKCVPVGDLKESSAGHRTLQEKLYALFVADMESLRRL